MPIDCSEEIRLLKETSIFQHIIELREDTATNMRRRSILFDQALQMCGGSPWVKIDCHIHVTPVFMNVKLFYDDSKRVKQ